MFISAIILVKKVEHNNNRSLKGFRMNANTILIAVLISFTFTAWPILAKYSGAHFAWVNLIIYAGGLVAVAVMGAKRLVVETITTKALILLVAISVINGLAVWFYTVKATNKEINTSLLMVTVSLSGIIIAPLLNLVMNNETLTSKQWLGVLLALVVVWLMKK